MVTTNFIENSIFDKNPSLFRSLSDKKKNNFNFNEIKIITSFCIERSQQTWVFF